MWNSSTLSGVGVLDDSPEPQKSQNTAILDCPAEESEKPKRKKMKRHERTNRSGYCGCKHGCS